MKKYIPLNIPLFPHSILIVIYLNYQMSRFIPFPYLTTDRFFLRELKFSDLNRVYKLKSTPEVMRFVGNKPYTSLNEATAFISKITSGVKKGEFIDWIITNKNDPKSLYLGSICLWNFNIYNTEAEIGYEILPEEQGKGLVSETIPYILNYGFNLLDLITINATVHIDNTPSIKILEKSFFSRGEMLNKQEIKYSLPRKIYLQLSPRVPSHSID
jgi:[ribosomal protein S5]-alanine N-acetyltransferase